MYKRLTVLFLAVTGFCFFASGQIISGRVVTSDSTAVSDASVVLRVLGKTATTGTDGKFSINLASSVLQGNKDVISPLKYSKSSLIITSQVAERVHIDVYNLRGEKLYTALDNFYDRGIHAIPMSSIARAGNGNGVYLAKVNKGNDRYIMKLTPTGASVAFGSGVSSMFLSGTATTSGRTHNAEVLIVSKTNYQPRTLDITSYTTQDLGNIVISTIANDSALIEHKIDSLLALMTTAQKAAQMTQVMNNTIKTKSQVTYNFGSIFNGGETPSYTNTPAGWATRLDSLQSWTMSVAPGIPMIYGIDAVHGNGKIPGSTIFPHNIGLGCTHDTALVEQVGRITASECAAVGVHLAFAPCVAVVRNEKWGRTYEGFGETPEINTQMGTAFLRGLQGDGDISKNSAIAGCVKHYLGDGGTADGVNGGITTLTETTMRALHFPPYIACAKEKMASIMPSYNSWSRNGTTIEETLDSFAIIGMLENEQKWDGFVISDYDAIPQAFSAVDYNSTSDYQRKYVAPAINAGVDIAMISDYSDALQYIKSIQAAVDSGYVTLTRLNDAVRRILRIKYRMHLWDHPKSQSALILQVGDSTHRAVARAAVRESMVLLKNDSSALPLTSSDKIVVVGPWADSMGAQCGGWTVGWQGVSTYSVSDVGGGETILTGLKTIGNSSNITYNAKGTNLSSSNATKIVLVLGEIPYAEGVGDFSTPALSNSDSLIRYADLVDLCYSSGKKVVIVLISGRPLIITDQLAKCDAFVAAWLPGSEGIGVADVLYGNYNFTGKLTHTWPKTVGQIPINTGSFGDATGSGGTPLFEYGYGLTYKK
jgi:beta-glucosidase